MPSSEWKVSASLQANAPFESYYYVQAVLRRAREARMAADAQADEYLLWCRNCRRDFVSRSSTAWCSRCKAVVTTHG